MPQITTSICTYRRPKLLARALASLAAQTCRDFSVRVFDNASGDETAAIVEWFRCEGLPVEYHCHPENIGMQRNFRFAFSQELTSPYFHLLNDDDYLMPRFFEVALRGFAADPEAVFSVTRNGQATADGQVRKIQLANWRSGRFAPGEGAVNILRHGHPEFTAVLYRSEWVRKSGGFDFSTFGNGCDVAFHVLAAARHSIYASPEFGGVFSVHPDQLSESGASTDTWGKLFERLQRTSFLTEDDFLACVRAAAACHILILRNVWPAAGVVREWKGLKELADLCRRRPGCAGQALLGYFDMLVSAFHRKLHGPEPADDPEVHRPATAQVRECAAMLQAKYVAPCLKSVGLASD